MSDAEYGNEGRGGGSRALDHLSQRSSGLAPGKRTLVEQAFAAQVQMRASESPRADHGPVHATAARGIATPGAPLPHRDTIQRVFGRHDVSSIQAHTGTEADRAARALGAEAYAAGEHVAFAGTPSLHTAAHEAAHVVQQRGGVQLKGGIGAAGDPYEQHADAVADRAVRGESAEVLLDAHAGAGGRAPGGAVQRMIYADADARTRGNALDDNSELVLQLLAVFMQRGQENVLLDILVSETNRVTVAELCKHLDTLPEIKRPEQPPVPSSPNKVAPAPRDEVGGRQSDKREVDRPATQPGKEPDKREHDDGRQLQESPSRTSQEPPTLPTIEAHMGQGVSGNLTQYNLYSGSFSTCTPIVMFNAGTRRAGLFHLPHKSLGQHEAQLLAMVQEISPTEIRICKGGYYVQPGRDSDLVAQREYDSMKKEGEKLAEFFTAKLSKHSAVTITDGQTSYGYLTLSLDHKSDLTLTKGVRSGNAFDLKDQPAPEGAQRYQRDDWTYAEPVG